MPDDSTAGINIADLFFRVGRYLLRHLLAGVVLTTASLMVFGITYEELVRHAVIGPADEEATKVRVANEEADAIAAIEALKNGTAVLEREPRSVPGSKGRAHDFNPLDWGKLLHLLR